MLDAAPGQTMYDAYDALIFLAPVETCRQTAMVDFLYTEEFKHELWGYRRFCKNRDSSEQRPWASSAKARMKERLEADRKKIRGMIAEREAKEAIKKKSKSHRGW